MGFAFCWSAAISHRPQRQKQNTAAVVPNIITGDIQAGIEKHIAEQTQLGNGFFTIDYEGKPLKLKLVRVHTEYLANLGPQRHFACVDMATTDGDVYDVDFFLAGDPGSMTVTETTVHKFNGQPYYAWKQSSDKTWHRVPSKTPRRKCSAPSTAATSSSFSIRQRCRS